MPITLAIDVGLKNLALCLTAANAAEDTFEILYWDVLNVIDDPETLMCTGFFKNGNMCTRKALYKSLDTSKATETCETTEEATFCKTHFPDKITRKNTIKFPKISDYNNQQLSQILIDKCNELFEKPEFQDIQNILIELQPTMNRKMLFVSNVIFTKFVERYSVCNSVVRFVRASKKLKTGFKNYTGPQLENEKKLKGYKLRKWKSVEYTKSLLDGVIDADHWKDFLDSCKKQDDLCDTFLMCVK